jgi:hypothetical protein
MKSIAAAACIATLAPWAAHAQSPSDIQALRDEIRQMREQYEARIKGLEARLEAAQSRTAAPATAGPTSPSAPAAGATAQVSPAAAVSAAPAPADPVATGSAPASRGKGFNPQMSLILSGLYTRTGRDPATYSISGFNLPTDAEVGPGRRGFSLAESELGLSASIDPWWRGFAAFAFSPDNSVSVEEAYVETTALGHGLTLKGGRFFSSIGYQNSQHAHVWDFVDAPLAYQAMLGGQYADDGLQLAWLAPTDTFLEVRGEIGRGLTVPATDTSRNGPGSAALSLHSGGDIGDSSSWRAGVSVLDARGDAGVPSTRVWIADGVWKWSPGGNATRTNFKLQGEYLRSVQDGRPAQTGWYTQAVYQFMRGWRVGMRTERLDPGTGDPHPRKNSLMLDWSPSEFSRVRLQYSRDQARGFGGADNQWFLQYMMSLGAHGAHGF